MSPAVVLKLGTNVHGTILDFWAVSLDKTENNWAADMTADIPTFDVRTANASEQMNHSTKNGSMAVNPFQRTDQSANTMMDKSNHRLEEKCKKDHKTFISNCLWSRSDSKDMLTECTKGLAVALLDKRNSYAVVPTTTNKWWVLWVKEQEVTFYDRKEGFDEDNLFSRKCHHPIYK